MPADIAEALRYLGYRGNPIEPGLRAMLMECVDECSALERPGFVKRTFELVSDGGAPRLEEAGLALEGESIREFLRGAEKCVLLAATLGVEIDARIRALQHSDMSRAVILDACASSAIERFCDGMELSKEGYEAGARFSPGYGDFPLSCQDAILRITDARRRIGLTCSISGALTPRKSITAVVGLLRNTRRE